MADTAHFGWSKPTPGGDDGAWGGILNTAFDDIDADLYPVAGKLSEQMYVHAAGGSGLDWVFGSGASCDRADGPGYFHLPLPSVKPGQRITGFTSLGSVSGAATGTVKLAYIDNTGAETIVSAGHNLPGSEAETSTTGLTHDVAASRSYYIRVETSGASGSVFFRAAKLAVEASP